MGYTHYWNHGPLSEEDFSGFAEDVRKILKASKVKVQLEFDIKRPPEVSNDQIRFNGKGEEGHETFVIERKSSEDFCKTANKPYDEVVVACLLSAVDHFASFSVRSDGDWEEWTPGRALYEKATGRKASMPKGLRC